MPIICVAKPQYATSVDVKNMPTIIVASALREFDAALDRKYTNESLIFARAFFIFDMCSFIPSFFNSFNTKIIAIAAANISNNGIRSISLSLFTKVNKAKVDRIFIIAKRIVIMCIFSIPRK